MLSNTNISEGVARGISVLYIDVVCWFATTMEEEVFSGSLIGYHLHILSSFPRKIKISGTESFQVRKLIFG